MRKLPAVFAAAAIAVACKGQIPATQTLRIELPSGFRPTAITSADFNGDKHADVAITGESERLLILLGDGRGGLKIQPESARAGKHPSALAASDLNGDHRIDLVVANHDSDHLTVLIGDGAGRFTSREVPVHSNPHPHMVAAADVDGDGQVDLITDSWMENRLTVVSSDGHGGWRSPGSPIDIGRKPYWTLTATDLDGDGHVDLVTPNNGSGTVSILLGDGHGHFQHASQSPIAAGPQPFSACVADVNGDGRPDIVVANYSGHLTDTAHDGITWIRNDGARHFTAFAVPVAGGRGSARIAAGDFNGDGFIDVAVSNQAASNVTIAYGSRAGLRKGVTVPTMRSPHAIALARLDQSSSDSLLVVTEDRDELLVITARGRP